MRNRICRGTTLSDIFRQPGRVANAPTGRRLHCTMHSATSRRILSVLSQTCSLRSADVGRYIRCRTSNVEASTFDGVRSRSSISNEVRAAALGAAQRGGNDAFVLSTPTQASQALKSGVHSALSNGLPILSGRAPHARTRGSVRMHSGSASEGVLTFQDSKVVTNVAKGEKMTEVNYERKKTMQVLFIDEESGSKETMTLEEIVRLAEQKDLDPVMVAPDAEVPVMKLMDFRKERHRILKKQKEASKNASTLTLKEVRLGLNVGKSDLDRLMKQAAGFLEKGHRVKLFMRLKGKDFYTSQDQASEILAKMASSLADVGTVENPAELVGRSTNIFLSPLKKKKGAEKGGGKNKEDQEASATNPGKEKKGKKDKKTQKAPNADDQ